MNDIIRLALKEDIGSGDITTRSIVPAKTYATAHICAKDGGVLFGMDVARKVFYTVDKRIKFNEKAKDGSTIIKGQLLAIVSGPAGSIMTAERTALNFIQRLSGVATVSRAYATAVKGTGAKVLDTRKTTPGMRLLEKQAVKAGGCHNHRVGLYDMVLIKDNHLMVEDISSAINKCKTKGFVEVEVKSFAQIEQALKYGADRILLDNMSVADIKKAVKMIKQFNKQNRTKITTEASGGITLRNIRKAALTGVDYISVGAITHSAGSLDIALDIKELCK